MLRSIRHAVRTLRRTPGFSLVAIGSLAIGIGATSATFSIADALLLRPLAVPDPDRVVTITPSNQDGFGVNTAISYPDYRDLRDSSGTFEGLVAASFTSLGFSPDANALPKVAYGMFVSGNFFRTLHVRTIAGRGILDSEDQAIGRDPVVVL